MEAIKPQSIVTNEDCMIGMSRYPDGYFDLAIVDPEYGINASKGTWGSSNAAKVTDYGKKDWDKNSVDKNILNEILRVSKNQVIWGANHFISKIPFDSPCWIVWDKLNSADFADCELAWTSFDSAVRKFSFRWNGMLQGDMKNKETRIHPTQKPRQLYKWILQNYGKRECNHKHTKEYNHLCTECSKPVKILDTHLGSGSSRIAAYDMGFDFTGFELDKDYFEAQEKRYQNHIKQLTMFPH